jgi:succinate dehydrogenase/fumarate reductase flavoprotein subunit
MSDDLKGLDLAAAISRRAWLGGVAAGIGAGALSGTVNPASAWGAPAIRIRKVQEYTADVVVAGAGMGGLSAAVRAAHSGAKVILLEKAPQVGGTVAHSEGGVANSEYDHMRLNSPDGDPVVQRNVYDNVERWYGFMEEIGAPITRAVEGMRLGGQQQGATARQGRTIAPVVWVRFMAREFQRLGGTILTETPITRLRANGLREIVGVEAEGPQGPVHIRAKAVVLATGGWMHNDKMVNENITRHKIWQRNVSHNRAVPLFTGDGFHAAQELGAAPSRGGWDAFYGYLLPAHPGQPQEPMANYSLYHANYSVLLNLYGFRFTDESGGKWGSRPRERFTARGAWVTANETAREAEASAVAIWDEVVNREYACADCVLGGADRYASYSAVGAPVARADTLEELASQIEAWGRGTPAERVIHQVREYNAAAAADKAWALPVPKTGADFGHVRPLNQGPFYAILGTPGITSTYGGLRVNSNGEVLDRYDRPIRGLFAAGVDIGGFSTYGYLGNLTLGASHGYLSGMNAARQPDPSGGWAPGFMPNSAML